MIRISIFSNFYQLIDGEVMGEATQGQVWAVSRSRQNFLIFLEVSLKQN
jgi:hypothetical protein